jgi:hypothetical protein
MLVYFREKWLNYETIYSNDLTKIERKKTSVVFSEPCISEIENYETIYSNDLTKIERKKTSVSFLFQ